MKGAKLHHTFANNFHNANDLSNAINHIAVSIRDIKILEHNHLRTIACGKQ